eukprot:TRINITY_DN10123_c0_g1_i1.p1 TRINITY_DN10123_c0_g1~~TRINITY_DN10123_c0_g1_i1.p1  ORF type:complete len:304 (-),score=33.60 TRINITY_DN10123_c0_g1_i1:6-917(-)
MAKQESLLSFFTPKSPEHGEFFKTKRPQSPLRPINSNSIRDADSLKSPPTSSRKRRRTENSAPSSPIHSPISSSKRSKKDATDDKSHQLVLDAGQKVVGTIVCSECRMPYSPALKGDVETHKTFHKHHARTFQMPEWKAETLAKLLPDGSRIITVSSSSPRTQQEKVKQLHEYLNREFDKFEEDSLTNSKTYLYISLDNQLTALVIVSPINQGLRLKITTDEETPEHSHGTIKCDAQLGFERLWVNPRCRRRRVASRLLNVVRGHYVFGATVQKDMCALAKPTLAGIKFAEHYFGRPDFLVYK